MSSFLWRFLGFAYLRADCVPYGTGEMIGWRRLTRRLYRRVALDRLSIRAAYIQGWIDGNQRPWLRDMDKARETFERLAAYYVNAVSPAEDRTTHE